MPLRALVNRPQLYGVWDGAVGRAAGIDSWVVLGHSWGSDLAVRYALDHPDRVRSVVGVAGHELHKDRTWSQAYESARHLEADLESDWEPDVHTALNESFVQWIHEPGLLTVMMRILVAELLAQRACRRPFDGPPNVCQNSEEAAAFVSPGINLQPDFSSRTRSVEVPILAVCDIETC